MKVGWCPKQILNAYFSFYGAKILTFFNKDKKSYSKKVSRGYIFSGSIFLFHFDISTLPKPYLPSFY